MNIVVSAVVGTILATATLIGGVHAAKGQQQKPVSTEQLFAYTSK